jgi:DNA ligase 1|tara:strand:+ start:190 stop:1485 length:1296 start_codon:yes stop_codon:yes gene_type:complete
MKTDFQLISDFVEASNATNSNSDKLEVLKTYTQYESVCKALNYTYDTYKQYGVTSANCKKNSDLMGHPNTYGSIFTLLDDLNNRVATGHTAIANVNRFVHENFIYADLIWNMIDRNLKTRSTASMINKVKPGLIPTFDVALAKAFDEKTQKKVDWNDCWFVSRKLDGVRCLTVIDENGEPKFFSRQGKEFLTLDNLKTDIKALGLKNTVLDGEVCIVDGNGDEDFTGIIKEIKRKDHTIESPYYWMFDMLTMEEFSSKKSKTVFAERIANLQRISKMPSYFIGVLDQWIGSDKVFSEMMAESKAGGWEGLMLRKNETYKGKRSTDILKVKQMFDEEYIVVDLENDVHRVIVDGAEVEEEMLKNVIIEHKGNRVHVGSGFSHEQRRHYFANPNEILGKQITVQYFEESQSKSGEFSLRFPVIKAVYDGVRTF